MEPHNTSQEMSASISPQSSSHSEADLKRKSSDPMTHVTGEIETAKSYQPFQKTLGNYLVK